MAAARRSYRIQIRSQTFQTVPNLLFMRIIARILCRFVLIAGITAAALAATVTPTIAGSTTQIDLEYLSGIPDPGAPGKGRVLYERNRLMRPDRDIPPSRTAEEEIILNFEPEMSPEYKDVSVVTAEPLARKSYLIPALEAAGFVLALNGVARLVDPNAESGTGKKTYNSDFSTFWDNLTHASWHVDKDGYSTNQLRHPYQGAIFQGFARSAGLGFWESMGYTFLGSVLWETAGETEKPSVNDQVATGIGGNFLGEPLFRMASLLLESEGPGLRRELGAAFLSPPTGFNRLVFGDRFKAVFPGNNPAIFGRVDLGANIIAYRSGPHTGGPQEYGATVGFLMEYGLPGKAGYHYTRPFDYFSFEMSLATNYSSSFGLLCTRGLLFGREYGTRNTINGIWGVYGIYDYIATDPARVSSTAVSIGTTAQWRLSPGVTLQGTALCGIGYGAGGNVTGLSERNYHYGGIAQSLLDLRLILGDHAMIDLRGRQYYISDVAASEPHGSEDILRFGLGFTLRVADRHAIGLRYQYANRNSHYPGIEGPDQKMEMLSILYSFLGDAGFGAVP